MVQRRGSEEGVMGTKHKTTLWGPSAQRSTQTRVQTSGANGHLVCRYQSSGGKHTHKPRRDGVRKVTKRVPSGVKRTQFQSALCTTRMELTNNTVGQPPHGVNVDGGGDGS